MAADYVGWKAVQTLLRRSKRIELVVCHSSDPGGFNDRIREACKSCASFPDFLFQDRLADPGFIAKLIEMNFERGILAWWPEILRGEILSLPKKGWINFHPSFLPYNRGKHPNFWCLVEGTPCGVSLHLVTARVDGGDLLAQRRIQVSWEDTGETIYNRCREEIVALFDENIEDILSDRLTPLPQDETKSTFHFAREITAASTIDLDRLYRARDLLNLVRAKMFRPHAAARFVDGEQTYEIELRIRRIAE
jgi:methionyl-tRNA formyltransferase